MEGLGVSLARRRVGGVLRVEENHFVCGIYKGRGESRGSFCSEQHQARSRPDRGPKYGAGEREVCMGSKAVDAVRKHPSGRGHRSEGSCLGADIEEGTMLEKVIPCWSTEAAQVGNSWVSMVLS
jgi:hypothetical protein